MTASAINERTTLRRPAMSHFDETMSPRGTVDGGRWEPLKRTVDSFPIEDDWHPTPFRRLMRPLDSNRRRDSLQLLHRGSQFLNVCGFDRIAKP